MTPVWKKVTVTINTLNSAMIDLIGYQLFEMGAKGVQVQYAQDYLENQPNLFGEIEMKPSQSFLEHPVEIEAYYDEAISAEEIKVILNEVAPNTVLNIDITIIENQNWQSNWMQYYQVERISRHVVIVPEWQDYEGVADEQKIKLNPGVAFGTGNHPTTKLSGQSLEIYMQGGETVLDVGTGSGILSLIAAVLGAKEVHGYDLDPQAIDSAKHNLQLQKDNKRIQTLLENQKIDFQVNNLLDKVSYQADIIIANILPHILVDMLGQAKYLLKEDGYLILGGILVEKGVEIELALKDHQFDIVQKTQMKEWLSYVVRSKEKD